MIKNQYYVEWQADKHYKLSQQIVEVIGHWQSRYELGTAVILCDEPRLALKQVVKQWRKLTMQAQKARLNNASAQEILLNTRTISRMQRVKFSLKDPSQEPEASLYILNSEAAQTLPAHCLTLYSLASFPADGIISLLAPEALVVSKKTGHMAGLLPKAVLEERIQTEESTLFRWLEKQTIVIEFLENDMEQTNEALDLLLSSPALQTEFLTRTKQLLHTIQLAKPVKLSTAQQTRLRILQQLEWHVKILSPAYLSDHVTDTQSEDWFLLRDAIKDQRNLLADIELLLEENSTPNQHALVSLIQS